MSLLGRLLILTVADGRARAFLLCVAENHQPWRENMTSCAVQTVAETHPFTRNSFRDELITEHLHLVTVIASHMQRSMSAHVELDDLIHAGTIGLVDAASKFQTGRDVSFAGYAKHRIRGAILDSLRELDFASRDLRRRLKQVQAATRELGGELQREPTDAEVAAFMGLNTDRWQALMVDFRNLGSAAKQVCSNCEDQSLPEVPCSANEVPDQIFARAQLHQKMNLLIRGLPDRYQQVVTMYYERDMTMREIGDSLGVNESRVSQIHKSALGRMQTLLASKGVGSAAAFVN